MNELISRITILAVGVEKYDHMKRLWGPRKDVEQLRALLTENTQTALVDSVRFRELYDPTVSDLAKAINEYTMERSANGDILIFYFSGHGVPIGRDDFGFCTTDTFIHPVEQAAFPLTVVKYSELIQTIYIAGVVPVIIIDACYSGVAGRSLVIPSIEAIAGMQQQLHSRAASKYALLCSCSDDEEALDTPEGGVFSRCLMEVAAKGIKSSDVKKEHLTLHDIFPMLEESVQSCIVNSTPRLFLGATLPEIPLVMNTQYSPPSYALTGHLLSVIEALWNHGQPRDLTPSLILDMCGNGAYGNHSKLSLEPWDLVETVSRPRRRRLTSRGRAFADNQLKVPKAIIKDAKSGKWIPAENAQWVDISSFR
jgi:hypothetical protein